VGDPGAGAATAASASARDISVDEPRTAAAEAAAAVLGELEPAPGPPQVPPLTPEDAAAGDSGGEDVDGAPSGVWATCVPVTSDAGDAGAGASSVTPAGSCATAPLNTSAVGVELPADDPEVRGAGSTAAVGAHAPPAVAAGASAWVVPVEEGPHGSTAAVAAPSSADDVAHAELAGSRSVVAAPPAEIEVEVVVTVFDSPEAVVVVVLVVVALLVEVVAVVSGAVAGASAESVEAGVASGGGTAGGSWDEAAVVSVLPVDVDPESPALVVVDVVVVAVVMVVWEDWACDAVVAVSSARATESVPMAMQA
jgi:hypothetical protein